MSERYFRISLYFLLGAFVIHTIVSLIPTPVFGDDASHHLFWLEGFSAIRSEGHSYPRWLAQGFGGLGTSVFYFYPPLVYFLADLLSKLSNETSGTPLFQYTQLVTMILSVISAYLLMYRLTGVKRVAFLGALLYGLTPYRYLDVFTRSALTEHAAFVWLPLLILSCEYCLSGLRVDRMKAIVCSAIACAGLVLTNIPITAIMLVLFPIYALIRIGSRKITTYLPIVAGAVLSILLSAFYLLPVFEFRKYIQTDKLWNPLDTGIKWHHSLYEFFTAYGRKDSIGIICVFTILLGAVILYVLIRKREKDNILKAWLALIAVCLFLQLPFISDWVWQLIPPLHLAQFSWRLDSILTLAAAVVLSIGFMRGMKWIPQITIVLALFSFAWYAKYLFVFLTYPLPPDMVGDVRRSAPEYVPNFAEHDVRSIINSAKKRLDEPTVYYDSSQARVFSIVEGPSFISFNIASSTQTHITINHYYWPTHALTDGVKEIEIKPNDRGRITASIPPGEHHLRLAPKQSEKERQGIWISLAGLTLFAGVCIGGIMMERNEKH
jgi:hypothetical protein